MHASCTTFPTCNCTTECPIHIVSIVEVALAFPFELLRPCLVATPIAEVVHLACVKEHLNSTVQQIWDHEVVVSHPIARRGEGKINCAVAGSPFLAYSQLLLDIL